MTLFLGFELELTIEQVLLEADGPQLCSGADPSGQRWLVFRSRSDGQGSVWLCSPITDLALRQVKSGRATPRDAIRHSCTGVVEVVSCPAGGAVPERCLRCADIPEALLPPPDLRVAALVDSPAQVSDGRRSVCPVARGAGASTPAPDAGFSTSDQSSWKGALLCSAA